MGIRHNLSALILIQTEVGSFYCGGVIFLMIVFSVLPPLQQDFCKAMFCLDGSDRTVFLISATALTRSFCEELYRSILKANLTYKGL